MPEYDGDIKIGVQLSTPKNVVAVSRDLRNSLTSIFTANGHDNVSAKLQLMQQGMQEAVIQAKNLDSQMRALFKQKGKTVFTEEYKTLLGYFDTLRAELERLTPLRRERFELLSKGLQEKDLPDELKDFDEERYQKVSHSIDVLLGKMARLKKEGRMQRGYYPTEESQKEADKLAENLRKVNNKMLVQKIRYEDAVRREAEKTADAELKAAIKVQLEQLRLNSQKIKDSEKLRLLQQKEAEQAARVAEKMAISQQRAAEQARKVWMKKMQSISRIISNAFNKSLHTAQNLLKRITRHFNNINKSTNRGFKNILRYAFGIRGIFMLVRRIRALFKEVFTEIAKQSEPFGKLLKDFKNAWTEFKGAFVSAFTPIAQVVLPILTSIINKLVQAANTVGMFLASLLGQKTYLKASAIEEVDEALQNTAASAKEAKKQILGFDDVTILSDPNKNNGTESGSSDSKWEFAETPIDNAIDDIAKRLRELIQNQDWEGVGNYFAEAVNSVFTKAYQAINNSKFQEKVQTTIDAVTTTINSFAKNTDWKLIGSTIASGINLAFSSLNRFFSGVDWYGNAVSFTEGINKLIEDIDWDEIGLFIANRFNAVIQSALGFIETFDWETFGEGLGESLNTFLTNFDFVSLGKGINALVTGLVKAIVGLVRTVDWTEVVNCIFDGIFALFGVETYHATTKKAAQDLIAPFTTEINNATKELQTFGMDAQQTIDDVVTKSEELNDMKDRFYYLSSNVHTLTADELTELKALSDKLVQDMPELTGAIDDETGAWKGTYEQLDNVIKSKQELMLMDAMSEVRTELAKRLADGQVKVAEAELKVNKGLSKNAQEYRSIKPLLDSYWANYNRINEEYTNRIANAKDSNEMYALEQEQTKKLQELTNGLNGELQNLGININVSEDNLRNTSYVLQAYADAHGKTTTEIEGEIRAHDLAITELEKLRSEQDELVEHNQQLLTSIENNARAQLGFSTDVETSTKKINNQNYEPYTTEVKRVARSNRTEAAEMANGMQQSAFTAGDGMPREFNRGFKGATRDGLVGVNSFVTQATDAFTGMVSAAGDIGGNTSSAFAQGILNRAHEVFSAIGTVSTQAIQRSKNILQIKSPSRVFRDEVGEMIPLGIAEGIDDGTMGVLSTVSRLSESLVDKATNNLKMPSIAAGRVIPYSSAQQGTNTEQALLNILDLLYNNRVTEESLRSMMTDVVRENLNIEFYIGDEQISRHAQAGSARIDRRLNPVISGSY